MNDTPEPMTTTPLPAGWAAWYFGVAGALVVVWVALTWVIAGYPSSAANGAAVGHGVGVADILLTGLLFPGVWGAAKKQALLRFMLVGFFLRLLALVLMVVVLMQFADVMPRVLGAVIAYFVQFFGMVGSLAWSLRRQG